MAEFDTSSLTKEQIAMAMKCKTADELIALAKKMGVVITKEQAEAYLTELQDYELDDATLERIAGGVCWTNCPSESSCLHHVCGTVGWENFKGC